MVPADPSSPLFLSEKPISDNSISGLLSPALAKPSIRPLRIPKHIPYARLSCLSNICMRTIFLLPHVFHSSLQITLSQAILPAYLRQTFPHVSQLHTSDCTEPQNHVVEVCLFCSCKSRTSTWMCLCLSVWNFTPWSLFQSSTKASLQ